MDNASRYMLGVVIGMLLGLLLTIWVTTKLSAVRPLPEHRVSIDNDQHVYWCHEYAPAKDTP